MINKTQSKTTWSEKDLYELYYSAINYNGNISLDWDDSIYDFDKAIYHSIENCAKQFYNKTIPTEEQLVKMIEKWITKDIREEIKTASKFIAELMLVGMQNYAGDNQPENEETKLERLAQELKIIESKRDQLLSNLTEAEQKKLTKKLSQLNAN